MDRFIRHIEQISVDTERCAAFCLAYVALVQYLTLCDGAPSNIDIAQQRETKALFMANENLSEETKTSLEVVYSDEKPIFFRTRKYLDSISTDDLTVLKDFLEYLHAENEAGTEQEQIAWGKFISYYEERTDNWHWERSTEKWIEDIEELSSFTYTGESNSQSGLKNALKFSAMVVGGVLLVGMGLTLGKEIISTASKVVPINEMSDNALLQKLSRGMKKGENISERAHYIIEAYNRGLPIPKLYKP